MDDPRSTDLVGVLELSLSPERAERAELVAHDYETVRDIVDAARSGFTGVLVPERLHQSLRTLSGVVDRGSRTGATGERSLSKCLLGEPDKVPLVKGYKGARTAVNALRKLAKHHRPGVNHDLFLLVIPNDVFEDAYQGARGVAFDKRVTPLIGSSDSIRSIRERIQRLGSSSATVLILGESGTGKEVVARAIHASGNRAGRPFVAINCAAVSPNLIETELFGHERGAFTGADTQRAGCFERAVGGTLFLDEIAEMDVSLQAKLLRVLQEGVIRRVGGAETFAVDVRVLAATNLNPKDSIAEGRLREDLYYRLQTIVIELTPLRERRSDIPELARHFLRLRGLEQGRTFHISGDALARLGEQDWPGNVRELKSVIERATLFTNNDTIEPEDLRLDSESIRTGKREEEPKAAEPEPARLPHTNRFLLYVAASIIGLLALYIVFWPTPLPIMEPESGMRNGMEVALTDESPLVLGVYPHDSFGPLRREGLEASLDTSELKLVSLDSASLGQMKSNDVDFLLEELSSVLLTRNVLAVVGPPVTEVTRSIVEEVGRSAPGVPVFVESAVAKPTIDWDQSQVPLYRISSGIDKRASELAGFVEQAVADDVPVHLIIERSDDGSETYGEYLYTFVRRSILQWDAHDREGSIRVHYFSTGAPEASFDELDRLVREPGVILLFGLGGHYKAIADEFYRVTGDATDEPEAVLGGWMNAFAVQSDFMEHEYHWNKLFEITDFAVRPMPQVGYAEKFKTEIGEEPSPAVRDQAFSFDAGLVIVQAYQLLDRDYNTGRADGQHLKLTDPLLKAFNDLLKSKTFEGVTGPINFDDSGENGGGRLDYTHFDGRERGWVLIAPHQLLTK